MRAELCKKPLAQNDYLLRLLDVADSAVEGGFLGAWQVCCYCCSTGAGSTVSHSCACPQSFCLACAFLAPPYFHLLAAERDCPVCPSCSSSACVTTFTNSFLTEQAFCVQRTTESLKKISITSHSGLAASLRWPTCKQNWIEVHRRHQHKAKQAKRNSFFNNYRCTRPLLLSLECPCLPKPLMGPAQKGKL